MTYSETTDEARQCARESLCEGCEGIDTGFPCHMEDRCDGFKDEAVKIQTEMDEEVELDRVVIQMRGKKGVTLHYADVGVGK